MNILIIEDCVVQGQALKGFIEKEYLDIRVYSATTFKMASEIYRTRKIDLFFIDINLGIDSGLNIAHDIRKIKEYIMTGIIFVTTEMVHIIDAFKNIHCYDFLIKPYKYVDIKQIIDIFFELKSEDIINSSTVFNVGSNLSVRINNKDIIFIEYKNRKIYIYTIDDVIELSGESLKKINEKIGVEYIAQTHKSYLVNIKKIIEIEKVYNKLWEIRFKDIEEKAQLSYLYRDELLNLI